jgi:ParB family chromosome partitioning protein
MSKLDRLTRDGAAAAAESMGAGVTVVHNTPRPGPPPVSAHLEGVTRIKNVAAIPVGKIDRDPNQPREEFDAESLGRLAESLKARGQLQPIRVRWDEGRGVYVIVCGERRWRAARMAGLATVSAVIVEGPLSPDELLAIQLVENALREDLRPVEQARAYKALIVRNNWTVRQAAEELAVNHSAVVRSLALLDLPETAQADVEQGTLTPTTAYEIAKVTDPSEREELARRAVAEKMTGAEVRAVRGGKAARPRPRRIDLRDPNGCTVTVTIPDGLDDDDAFTALQRAVKNWRKTRGKQDAA